MAGKKKILVVDDEESFTWLVKAQLERSGAFEVRAENESVRVIETARQFRPDLILLDIVMPGLDGGDVEALLKKDPDLRQIPVIIVSALFSHEDWNADADADADADASGDPVGRSGEDVILAKPIETNRLIAAIGQKLGGG